MLKRFRAIEKWCEKREIGQQEAFFRGADPSIADEADRMAYVRRTKAPRMYDTDEVWITKCEAVIRTLDLKAVA